ncbi:MAG: aldo/keto reductase [Acidobacteriota bacterium]
MDKVTLNTGSQMPLLGFGTYQIADRDECVRAVSHALQVGYRLVDTAAAYRNEEAVGEAIRNSGLPRGELFVVTKLWIQDAGYEQAKRAFERSLKRLGLDYLDLYLIHQPYGDVHGAWRALEDLYREGVVRAVGVSNFHPDRLMDLILHHEVVPAVNQIETHPFYQQEPAQRFLRQHGVQHMSWGPFAEGRNDVFQNPVLLSLAEKHRRTVAQVILRWLIQRNIVAIPKSVHPERIEENFQIFDFELTAADMAAVAILDSGASLFFDHRDPAMVERLCQLKLPD